MFVTNFYKHIYLIVLAQNEVPFNILEKHVNNFKICWKVEKAERNISNCVISNIKNNVIVSNPYNSIYDHESDLNFVIRTL